jgi:Zn finger protein HypA/HybF involved in hydrogenase expression
VIIKKKMAEQRGVDFSGEMRFECLRCGKASEVEKLRTIRPRCGKCGSSTGILGDIGQGTLTSRLRRNFHIGVDHADDIDFECLSCGETTKVEKVLVLQPKCLHCGAISGLLVEGGTAGEIGLLVAGALLWAVDPGP